MINLNSSKILLGIVTLITLIIYTPSLFNGFVNWDDSVYILENTVIQSFSFENFKTIWTTQVPDNYIPLTMLSLAINFAISGFSAWSYHATNLLFHLCNVGFVFYLIYLLSGKNKELSFITALLFGIHPMHVESVAWVTERKDVLYSFFFIPALISYYYYLSEKKSKYILWCFFLFICALLSKVSAITLVLLLPLMDWWLQRKWSVRVILEKFPFLVLAVVFGMIALNYQEGAVKSMEEIAFFDRLNFSSYGLMTYVFKTFVPIHMINFYPYPNFENIPPYFYYMPILVIALLIGVFYGSKKWKMRGLWFGFLFFMINISIALQVVAVGEAIMADRYTYVAYIGLFWCIGIGFQKLSEDFPKYKQLSLIVMVSFITLMASITWSQIGVWKDGITLWTNAEEKAYFPTPRIYTNKANAHAFMGLYDEALKDYKRSLEIWPNDLDALINSGIVLFNKGEYPEAVEMYNKALELNPDVPNTFSARADAYFRMGEYQKAINDYQTSLSMNPNQSKAYNLVGYIYTIYNQDFQRAIQNFNQSIALDPEFGGAYLNRSKAYLELGDNQNAILDMEKAKQLGMQIDQAVLDSLKMN